MSGEAIGSWLRPIRSVLDPADRVDWDLLDAMDADLDTLLAQRPVGADLPAGVERSLRLRAIRREMADRGYLDLARQHPLFQVFAQFVCGYRDVDLRDTVGLGHGQLIARHACPDLRDRWIPRLVAGELAGIAITEPHGGSRPTETRTCAALGPRGSWLISGRKMWLSRLAEAAVFVVFFRDPAGRLAAGAIDAGQPGLLRQFVPPTGLAGWTWGILDLCSVPVQREDVLVGEGMTLLREHFAAYRPLVTATALGGAASAFDTVSNVLSVRKSTGDLSRLRDSALVTLGRTHAQLVCSLLGAAVAACLTDIGFGKAEQWSCSMKAHGIDSAHQAATELALLLGAGGQRADSPIAKVCRDLGALLCADGIHDSLYRSAGKHHTAATTHLSGDAVSLLAQRRLAPFDDCQGDSETVR